MDGAFKHACDRSEMLTKIWFEILKGREHSKSLSNPQMGG
jgi:hypothetical protein